MLHIFKLNGHRAAYDCAARTYHPLSALAMKIIESVTPPLSPECPSALRYSLAKYDSGDLSAAYREVYALYDAGLLFADDTPAAKEPDTTFAVIHTTGAAAHAKIESAAAQGFSHMLVYLTDATPCLASTLRQTFACKLDLRMIIQLTDKEISDGDIATLNEAECFAKIPASDTWRDDVLALADRGLRYIDADLPANDSTVKEMGKLEKEMERRQKESTGFAFAPFEFALLPRENFDAHCSACAYCWACEICGGTRLTNGERTPLCDVERAAIECAVTLSAEHDN